MKRATLVTANTPGAVAIVHLHADHIESSLEALTGKTNWPPRRAVLCGFADIDEGLAVRLDDHAAQLMPHGGPRVIQKLLQHLAHHLGYAYEKDPRTADLFPEAQTPLEADVLHALAFAASPAAIDLLAVQPTQWASLLQQNSELSQSQGEQILTRSRTFDRLIAPPTVVVVGRPNVGKSTLTNALMGQTLSIVADLPGTTRDWVGGLVELNTVSKASLLPHDGSAAQTQPAPSQVAVHWLDTPGLRTSADAIEQRAIELAKQQIQQTDLLIAMRDPDHPWPDLTDSHRTPDLWVVNKVDGPLQDTSSERPGLTPDDPLPISAKHERHLEDLQHAVIEALGLIDLKPAPWAFSPTLREICKAADAITLTDYITNSSKIKSG